MVLNINHLNVNQMITLKQEMDVRMLILAMKMPTINVVTMTLMAVKMANTVILLKMLTLALV